MSGDSSGLVADLQVGAKREGSRICEAGPGKDEAWRGLVGLVSQHARFVWWSSGRGLNARATDKWKTLSKYFGAPSLNHWPHEFHLLFC